MMSKQGGGTDYRKLRLIKEILYWAWILKRAGVNVTFVRGQCWEG